LHGQRADYLRYAIDAYISGDREVQFEAMGQELGELRPGDIDALVNFFSSYRPAD
jgi:cytochrome c553